MMIHFFREQHKKSRGVGRPAKRGLTSSQDGGSSTSSGNNGDAESSPTEDKEGETAKEPTSLGVKDQVLATAVINVPRDAKPVSTSLNFYYAQTGEPVTPQDLAGLQGPQAQSASEASSQGSKHDDIYQASQDGQYSQARDQANVFQESQELCGDENAYLYEGLIM